MKSTIFIVTVTLMVLVASQLKAQTSAMKEVQSTVKTFMKAGDNNDIKAMDDLLDANYRVVMNRLFGSTEVSIMQREVYIQKVESKEFGGDKRVLTFSDLVVNGNTAMVNVEAKGAKSTTKSIIVLLKDEKGNWKLVSDTPIFM